MQTLSPNSKRGVSELASVALSNMEIRRRGSVTLPKMEMRLPVRQLEAQACERLSITRPVIVLPGSPSHGDMEKVSRESIFEETARIVHAVIHMPELNATMMEKPTCGLIRSILDRCIKTTKFPQGKSIVGLFKDEELRTEKIHRNHRIDLAFLKKLITFTAVASGNESISASVDAENVLAGREPETTNLLLLALMKACAAGIDSKQIIDVMSRKRKICDPADLLDLLQQVHELRLKLIKGGSVSAGAEARLGEARNVHTLLTSAFPPLPEKFIKELSDAISDLDKAQRCCYVAAMSGPEEHHDMEKLLRDRKAALTNGKKAAELALQQFELSEAEMSKMNRNVRVILSRIKDSEQEHYPAAPTAIDVLTLQRLTIPSLNEEAGSAIHNLLRVFCDYTAARDAETLFEVQCVARPVQTVAQAGSDHSVSWPSLHLWPHRKLIDDLQLAKKKRQELGVELYQQIKAAKHNLSEVNTAIVSLVKGLSLFRDNTIADIQESLRNRTEILNSNRIRAKAMLERIEVLTTAQSQLTAAALEYTSSKQKLDKLKLSKKRLLLEVEEKLNNLKADANPSKQAKIRSTGQDKISIVAKEVRNFNQNKYHPALVVLQRLQLHLPEVSKQFPEVDPFFGTSAQGLRQRILEENYTDSANFFPANRVPRRHEMLLAKWIPEEDLDVIEAINEDVKYQGWCVLKGYKCDDEVHLKRELSVLMSVQHPHILSLQGLCRRTEPPAIFLQFPRYAYNLKEYLDKFRPISQSQFIKLFRGVLEGLHHLHQMDFVHRDLKPENILVSTHGHAVLADFETSKKTNPIGSEGTVTVTSIVINGRYLAPEVVKQGYTKASDMYAFGCILIEAIAGPESAKTDISNLLKQLNSPLYYSLLNNSHKERPSAVQMLHHPFFRELAPLRKCDVCFGDFEKQHGIECQGLKTDVHTAEHSTSDVQAAEVHFTCAECFQSYVQSLSEEDIKKLRRREARIYCPKSPTECKAPAFTDFQIASMITATAFEAYVNSKMKLKEVALVLEMEREKKKDIAKFIQNMKDMDEEQRRVYTMAVRVRDMLTDMCPRCNQAFDSFSGCSALQCSRCPCNFCAWCLADCGADAHRHVANCPKNLSAGRALFATKDLWQKGRKISKNEAVTQFLRTLDPKIVQKVCDAVKTDLRAIGIEDALYRFR